MRLKLLPLLVCLSIAASGCHRDRSEGTGMSDWGGSTPQDGSDPRPLTWQFDRDDGGRIVGVTDPAGRAVKFRYERDDQRGSLRVVKTFTDRSEVLYEFDRHGRRTAMTDAAGTVSYEHDGAGNLTAARRAGPPEVRYEFDALGRVETLAAGAHAVRRHYDYLGRLECIDTPAGKVAFEYPPGTGEVVQILPNGIRSVRKYDVAGRLESIAHTDAAGRSIAKFTYAYRPDGLIREVRESTPRGEKSLVYEYDREQRLTSAEEHGVGRNEYRYDALGNRTGQTLPGGGQIVTVYDWAGRVLRHDEQPCAHDLAGTVSRIGGRRDEATFDHSPEGQLVAARSGRNEVRYRYDGDGYLIAREDARGTTRYVPDPLGASWRPLLSTAAQGEPTFYIWGDGETPLAAVSGSKANFFLQDHLGSVRYLVDGAGALVGERSYCPFGVPREALSGGLQPGFAGLFYDPAAGLYVSRARAYVPTLGRYLERDPEHRIPFGSKNDLSAYIYCGNDPVNQVDVTGMSPMPPPFMPPGNFDLLRRTLVSASPEQARILPLGHRDQSGTIPLGTYARTFVDAIRDPGYATRWYADRSAQAMSQGSLSGVMKSIVYDLAGGAVYAPGETREQRLAGAMWSLVPAMSEAKAITGMLHSASEGEAKHALREGADLILPGLKLRAEYHHMKKAAGVLEGADGLYNLVTGGRSVFKELSGGEQRGLHGNSGPSLRFFKDDPLGPWHFYGNAEGDESDYMPLDRVKASIAAEREQQATWDALDDIRSRQGRGGGGGPPRAGGAAGADPMRSSLGSPVGGIYLRGAGEALKQLGQLRGVAIDRSGRVILVSEQGAEVPLPPLELDDVVTVFRSVYSQGALYVSIDPKPDDPHGGTMLIRHDPGTAGTRA